MFARFNENPAMILQDIKETKRYGQTDARTDGQRENSISPTNKVCGGYNKPIRLAVDLMVSENFNVFHYEPLEANNPQGMANFGPTPQGLGWQDLGRGQQNLALII